jgi:serine/threonine-protein kinase
MDPNAPLFDALRESGLYTAEQLAVLPEVTAAAGDDPAALAERLQARDLLTGYQARKLRVNRAAELLVGPYLVLDKIGEGGMGKVFRAVERGTGRVVALKMVRAHLMANKVVRSRYRREAEAARALHHPNIVALLDDGEANGRHYLAMEFVNGSDLSRLVKELGPLPYPEACEYIRQAALGLQHAHEQGLIHRDIKPSNLLVCGERALPGTGGKATVKMLDMGLVRSLSEDPEVEKSELTRDGTVVGTPDYMAPEQAKNSSTVDRRADLYSLGCTLYMLLTGRPPFPDGTPIDKLLRHQLDPPPDPRTFAPNIPIGLVAILLRLLAKKPDNRYASAADLAAALGPYTTETEPPDDYPDLTVPSVRPRKPAVNVPQGSTALDLHQPEPVTPVRGAVAVAPPPASHDPPPARPVVIVRPVDPSAGSLSIPEAEAVDAEAIEAEVVAAKPIDAGPARRPRPRPRSRKIRRAEDNSRAVTWAVVVGVAVMVLVLAAVIFTRYGPGKDKDAARPSKTEATPRASGGGAVSAAAVPATSTKSH